MRTLLLFLLIPLSAKICAQVQRAGSLLDFIPKTYTLSEKITGDLNNDGLDDCVLIVKATSKSGFVTDDNGRKVDRNRRGIIVLFKRNGRYVLASKNERCFASENEDGGVYYPPELSVEIAKGNLYISYGHGRYGYWRYTFRWNKTDFELIGYDESENRGSIVNREISINFLTGKKREKVNTNPDAEGGDEVFKETWKKIAIRPRLRLSAIRRIDELDMTGY